MAKQFCILHDDLKIDEILFFALEDCHLELQITDINTVQRLSNIEHF